MSKNELVILGLLNEKPMHGYQINQEIKERQMDHWAQIALPSIYNSLTKLEESGLVTMETEKVGKMPERHVYHITPEGKAMLADLVEEFLMSEKEPDMPFYLGVAFVYGLSMERALNSLGKRQEHLEHHYAQLKQIRNQRKGKIPFNWFMIIENGLKHMTVEQQLIQRLRKEIERMESWDDITCNNC
jgi:DNA-binding PadR family transcriptional regulator